METTKHTHISLNSRTKSQIQILYSREFLQHQSVHQAIGTQLPYKHNTSLIHSRMNIIGMCSVHGLPIYLSTRIFTRYTNVERIMHAICERHTPRRYLSPAMPLARMPQQTVKPMCAPVIFQQCKCLTEILMRIVLFVLDGTPIADSNSHRQVSLFA